MRGTYKVGDVEVSNVITDAGRLGVLNAIAGRRQGFADLIEVGIGNVAATAADKQLQFSVAQTPITSTILDTINERVYFKATLPSTDDYWIYELAIFPDQNKDTFQSREIYRGGLLLAFNSITPWIDISGISQIVSNQTRLSPTGIKYDIASSTIATGRVQTFQDFSDLAASTQFTLAYNTFGIQGMAVRFKTDDTNYFESQVWPVGNGYHIYSAAKSAWTVAAGSPSWSSINAIEISILSASGGGTIILDGFRYDTAIDASSMLSRAVLASGVHKVGGMTMDIEYCLELDI